ncbi:hypothetical protein ACZ90_21355 [Streptomyces albus subsp. albus]|nr:hypothetical protein ACZ90_21355 [Streptomyces albus subsp. albus]
MTAARLERIVRYPVKGFGGQRLDQVDLRAGRGLPFDRALAVTNGQVPVRPDGGWTRCQAFVRMTRNTELPLFRMAMEESVLTLTSPGGERLRITPDDPAPADEVLAGWFPSTSTRLVRAADGYWDHEDAQVSLINVETVRALSEAASRPLDPLRFRGNLYLRGLPAWSEFDLVGRRIRIGGCELEVLRPIERCRATSIDPVSGAVDVNVPALLGRSFGHVHCGLYARVVKGGRIAPGDPAVALTGGGHADPGAEGASHPADWPRRARIVSRTRESRDVVSLWLRDPLARLRPAPLPGQHLRVHGADAEGPLWRNYTVSGVEGDLLRLSVKRVGRMSSLLHSATESVLISGPFGEMVLPPADDRPLLLVSAGIGITPMTAMLRACVERGTTGRVTLLHAARDGEAAALWQEAAELAGRLPNGTARLFLSRPRPGDLATPGSTTGLPGAIAGRLDAASLAPYASAAAVFLCGPAAFMRQAKAALTAAGTDPGAIHFELFTAPTAAPAGAAAPPAPGPFTVRFADSGVVARWQPDSGSLLDLAEASGLQPRAACRSGACRTCLRPVSSGSTAPLGEPLAITPPGSVLLCSAVPTSDLTVRC